MTDQMTIEAQVGERLIDIGRWVVAQPTPEKEEVNSAVSAEPAPLTREDFENFMRQFARPVTPTYEIEGLTLTLEGVQALDKFIDEHPEFIADRQRQIVANQQRPRAGVFPDGYCTPSRRGNLTGVRPERTWQDETPGLGGLNMWRAVYDRQHSRVGDPMAGGLPGGGIDE